MPDVSHSYITVSKVAGTVTVEQLAAICGINANIAANNCVDGSSLNQGACATIFRNNPFLHWHRCNLSIF